MRYNYAKIRNFTPFLLGFQYQAPRPRSVVTVVWFIFTANPMTGMKFFRTIAFLVIVLSLGSSAPLRAQTDTIVISPNRASTDPCGFRMTVKNRNAAGAAIFKVRLELLSGDGTLFTDAQAPVVPTGWVTGYDETSLIDTFQAQNNGIAAGATLSGFKFAYYNDGTHEYDNAKKIRWTTYDNSGAEITSGEFSPVCVPFQYFATYDTATVYTDLSGCDPLFHFTVGNRNDLARPIGFLQFQLTSLTSGTIRPSKCSPANGWILDSVNAYSAYFHSDNDPIEAGTGKGAFTVALRANPNITKHNFAYWVSDDQDFLIDRDTIMNIPIQATCSNSDADSITADAGTNGCLYTMTVRNWHVANSLPPGPITKIVLKSQTAGVHFDAAPNAPPKWTKTVTADSIVYKVDSAKYGVAGGVITSAFSYSVSGPTTTPFTIGWQTFRPQGLISSSTITSSCVVQAPRGDSLRVEAGSAECDFVAHVMNLHNSPASNVGSISLSIPAGSGQLTGSSSSAGWNFANVSATEVKFTSTGTPQTTGSNQDLGFRVNPQTPGQPITLTCQTNDEGSAKIWSGTASIACTPAPIPCDTATTSPINIDSCWHSFMISSRGGADILSISFQADNQWYIDSIKGTPSGWVGSVDANGVATFTSSTGIHSGEQQGGYNLSFGCKTSPDNFHVTVTSTDRNNHACTNAIPLTCSCLDRVSNSGSEDPQISNIAIVPNPTRGVSELSFTLGVQERVFVTVFDALGKTVNVATNQVYGTGTYSLPLELSQQPAGNYYIRIQTPLGVVTKRIVKE